jgi:hypothetical protein
MNAPGVVIAREPLSTVHGTNHAYDQLVVATTLESIFGAQALDDQATKTLEFVFCDPASDHVSGTEDLHLNLRLHHELGSQSHAGNRNLFGGGKDFFSSILGVSSCAGASSFTQRGLTDPENARKIQVPLFVRNDLQEPSQYFLVQIPSKLTHP